MKSANTRWVHYRNLTAAQRTRARSLVLENQRLEVKLFGKVVQPQPAAQCWFNLRGTHLLRHGYYTTSPSR